jgi:tetratricopeptide (TPR) repeat protein
MKQAVIASMEFDVKNDLPSRICKRSALGCCIALSCFAIAIHAQEKFATLENQFQAAMAAQDHGDLKQAESLLLDLHQKHPGIFAVDESLGMLYIGEQKFEKALPFLQAGVKDQPQSDVAHVNLGASYYKLHRNEEALKEFQIAARLNPKKAETQQSLGQLLMETHHPAQAAEAFATALALDPGNADLLLNRAQALIDANHPEEAKRVLASFPNADNSAAAQSLLGDLDEKTGAYREAAEHYSRAVALDPTEDNVWNLAFELLRHWSFEAAAAELESAVIKFPQSTRLRLGLGTAYFGKANFGKAVPVFAELLQQDPENALYAELLGMSCTAALDAVQSECNVLVHYAQMHPKDAKVAVAAAAGLMQGTPDSEQIDMAYRLLHGAIAADPKLADARYRLGLLDQEQNNWARSIPSLESAIALKPDYAQAHYRLSMAYWRAGRKPEAKIQMELEKKYAQQQAEDLQRRLQQITILLADVHK